MVFCSLLTPAFSFGVEDNLHQEAAENFGVSTGDLELFALVPLSEVKNPSQVAVQLKTSSLSLSAIEDLLTQRDQLQVQLQKTSESLYTYNQQISQLCSPNQPQLEKILKLEEDNRKLRQMLKTQLENAESLKVATQKTVENLREEFNMLVKELMSAKEPKPKSEEKSKRSEKKSVVPKLKL